MVKDLIENDVEESFSSEPEEGSESEELGGSHRRQEKRPRNDDAEVDQKLERLKEQLLMELGAKDNIGLMLLTLSPFVKRIQLKTIPKKFMMPTLATYKKPTGPRVEL